MTNSEFEVSGKRGARVGLSAVETFQVTWRVAVRVWPYVVLSYLFAMVVGGIGLIVIFGVGSAGVGGGSLAAALFALFAMFLVLGIVSFIACAPFVGVSALATDAAVHHRALRWSEVNRRVMSKMLPLIGVMVATYAIVLVANSIFLMIPIFVLPPELGLLGVIIAFFPAVAVVIAVDLAPWVLMNEHRTVVGAIGRAAVLAKRGFLRLLGLHVVWGLGVFPLLYLASSDVASIVVVVVMLFVVIPGYVTFQGVVYADLVARETGVPIEKDFHGSAISVAEATAVFRDQWQQRSALRLADRPRPEVSSDASGRPQPSDPMIFTEPDPTTVSPDHGLTPVADCAFQRRRVPARPRPEMVFNTPPGWPPAPAPGLLAAGFEPDPSWPPEPQGWQFWTY